MSKIQELTQKFSEDVKDMVKKFPVTIILVIITTLVMAICTGQNWIGTNTFYKITTFLIIFAAGTFLSEAYFKNMVNKIIAYVLSAVISFVFVKLIFISEGLFGWQNQAIVAITGRVLFAYLSSLTLLILYKLIKESDLKFEEYLLRVFSKTFFSTLIYVILAIGVALLMVIFITLILNGNDSAYEFLYRTQILLFGLFYIPALMYSISEVKSKDVNAFIRGLVMYVMMPLVSISMLIIFIYIFKIIILQNMPSNVIYRILVGIFIVALPTWIMASNYREKHKIIGEAARILPFAYMPFILLEIYSIGIRIMEYGITPLRYVSAIFIVFQVFVLFFDVYKKREKFNYVFLVGMVLILISTISPINLVTASNLSQKNIIVRYLPEGTDFNSLTNEYKDKISGAYGYLESQYNGDNYIPLYITDEMKTAINKYIPTSMYFYNYNNEYNYEYINYYEQTTEIEVAGYSKIISVNAFNIDNGNITLSNISGNEGTVDIQNLINGMIANYTPDENRLNEFVNSNKIIKIDETKDLYISNISFAYNQDTKQIDKLDVNGYVLIR